MDMMNDEPLESDNAPEATAESSEMSDDEIQRILGKDLADLILTKSGADSVSCSD